jgi:hypothetical protein
LEVTQRMRSEVMLTTLVTAAIWAVGVVCGIEAAGGLPIWQRESIAPTALTATGLDDAHARLNAALVSGWEVERVVTERVGQIDTSTYVLRKPLWR